LRFYTKSRQYYCGIDLRAKTMYVCILNAPGEILGNRNTRTDQTRFLLDSTPPPQGGQASRNRRCRGWCIQSVLPKQEQGSRRVPMSRAQAMTRFALAEVRISGI
jgi:hypothetical protein